MWVIIGQKRTSVCFDVDVLNTFDPLVARNNELRDWDALLLEHVIV